MIVIIMIIILIKRARCETTEMTCGSVLDTLHDVAAHYREEFFTVTENIQPPAAAAEVEALGPDASQETEP